MPSSFTIEVSRPAGQRRWSGHGRPARPARPGRSGGRAGHGPGRAVTSSVNRHDSTLGHMWGERPVIRRTRWPGGRRSRIGQVADRSRRSATGAYGSGTSPNTFLDPPEVPHPGLGSTADPAAHRLHRHAELAGGRLLGQALPAQRARHPVGERRRMLLRGRGGPGGALRLRGAGRPGALAAAGGVPAGCGAATGAADPNWDFRVQHVDLDMLGEDAERDLDRRRSARPRRAGPGRRSRRPRGCRPRSAGNRSGSGGRSPGSPGSTRGARGRSARAPRPARPRSGSPGHRRSGSATDLSPSHGPASARRPSGLRPLRGYAALQTCPSPETHFTVVLNSQGEADRRRRAARARQDICVYVDRLFSLAPPRTAV